MQTLSDRVNYLETQSATTQEAMRHLATNQDLQAFVNDLRWNRWVMLAVIASTSLDNFGKLLDRVGGPGAIMAVAAKINPASLLHIAISFLGVKL
jgi:hypothetical protein